MPWKDWTEERKERHRVAQRKWYWTHEAQARADKRKREAIYRQDPAFKVRKAESDKRTQLRYRDTEKYTATRRRAHWKHKYGITPEQYDVMLKNQNGVCAICKQPETASRAGKIKLLSVDHNHDTKQLRGLLCDECNKALGNFHEKIERLQSAEEYLQRYS
jgi:hypothetical protein